jgi:hypothetical protein
MSGNRYKFDQPKDDHAPDNTGILGTMTLLGWNSEREVHEWRDNGTGSVWLTRKSQKYGRLVPSPTQPDDVPASACTITLPDGSQHRTIVLLHPDLHRYEPLGAVFEPAQAHVTTRSGLIVLTTCPALLRVERRSKSRRRAAVAAHDDQWYPHITQTMTLFDHDIDADVYLWRDDVIGGIWKTKPGKKYGLLSHWEGQPADQDWMIPMAVEDWVKPRRENAKMLCACHVPPAKDLWLVDPVRQTLDQDSDRPTIRSSRTGRRLGALAKPVVRMVNRGSIDDEQREGLFNDPETLYKEYMGIDPGYQSEGSGVESDTDSVWDLD